MNKYNFDDNIERIVSYISLKMGEFFDKNLSFETKKRLTKFNQLDKQLITKDIVCDNFIPLSFGKIFDFEKQNWTEEELDSIFYNKYNKCLIEISNKVNGYNYDNVGFIEPYLRIDLQEKLGDIRVKGIGYIGEIRYISREKCKYIGEKNEFMIWTHIAVLAFDDLIKKTDKIFIKNKDDKENNNKHSIGDNKNG